MPIENETRNDGPDADIASFQQACSEFWPNVTKIVCTKMRPRNPIELRSGTVVHMTNAEGKPINDSKGIIERYASIAKSDAERHGPCDYRIAVWGHREIPTSKRKVIARPEELNAVRFRLGDAGDEDGKGDALLIREAAALIKANAAATHDLTLGTNNIAGGYEKLLTLQQGMLATSLQRDEAHSGERVATAGIQLEIKKLEFNFEVQKETWRREDEKEKRVLDEVAGERKHDMALREKRNDMLGKMAEHALTSPHIAPQLGRVVGAIADLIESLKRGATAAGVPTDLGDTPPSTGTLGPKLAEILGKLDDAERTALERALGQDIWDVVSAASKTTSDDAFRALVVRLQEMLNPIDNPPSKLYTDTEKKKAHALRDQAFNAAAEILGPHWRAFLDVLTSAGLKLR